MWLTTTPANPRAMRTAKITVKLVRAFSVGCTIFSPTLNGFCVEINLACFSLLLWSKGEQLFAAHNHWQG